MSESVDAPDGERRRILTGLRPSGPSHVGHYAGAFSQWLELQEEYESFFLLADTGFRLRRQLHGPCVSGRTRTGWGG